MQRRRRKNKKPEAWICICCVIGPDDLVPLVMDPRKGPPHLWKFPGGHNELADGGRHTLTAIRETEEETGVIVREIEFLAHDPSGVVPVYLFRGKTDSFDTLKEQGDEGEKIKLVNVDEVLTMSDLLESHRQLLMKRYPQLDRSA